MDTIVSVPTSQGWRARILLRKHRRTMSGCEWQGPEEEANVVMSLLEDAGIEYKSRPADTTPDVSISKEEIATQLAMSKYYDTEESYNVGCRLIKALVGQDAFNEISPMSQSIFQEKFGSLA